MQASETFASNSMQLQQHPQDFHSIVPSFPSSKCTCCPVNHANRWQPLSILGFTRTVRTRHFSHCAEHSCSEESFEFSTHLTPPLWFTSYVVNVGFQIKNWRTQKPFSISPIIVGTSRFVDRHKSPAFIAIRDTKNAIYATGQHNTHINRLFCTLKGLFDEQKASVLDVDCNGRTLLNASIFLLVLVSAAASF